MGGVQGSLNVFKHSQLNASAASDKSQRTPALGDKFRSSSPKRVDEIPVDMEESEEYREDFDSSNGSAAAAKVSVSASGKLPPLSGTYPYGADQNSLSQSFQQSREEKKHQLSTSSKKQN